jgi:hypothetical protein
MTETAKVCEGILRRLVRFHNYEIAYEKTSNVLRMRLQKDYSSNSTVICEIDSHMGLLTAPLDEDNGLINDACITSIAEYIDSRALIEHLKSNEVTSLGDGLLRSYYKRILEI